MPLPEDRDFWRHKKLEEMSRTEWESLCDGCGKCCLIKLEYEDTGEIAYTDVCCKLLDITTARCTNYRSRRRLVPDCVKLSPENLADVYFMPATCAYRLLAEGKKLRDWHPLVTGDPDSVHYAGISVRQRVIPETDVPNEQDLIDHIVKWPNRK